MNAVDVWIRNIWKTEKSTRLAHHYLVVLVWRMIVHVRLASGPTYRNIGSIVDRTQTPLSCPRRDSCTSLHRRAWTFGWENVSNGACSLRTPPSTNTAVIFSKPESGGSIFVDTRTRRYIFQTSVPGTSTRKPALNIARTITNYAHSSLFRAPAKWDTSAAEGWASAVWIGFSATTKIFTKRNETTEFYFF